MVPQPICYSKKMFNSLKLKITVTAFLIVSIIMTFSTLRDIRETEKKLLNVQKEKAVMLSERISHGIVVLMLKNRWQDLQTFMESLTKDSKELKGIRIFQPENGIVLASSDPKDIGGEVHNEYMAMFKGQKFQSSFLMEREGEHFASKLAVIRNQPICYRCHGSEKATLGVLGIDISLSKVNESVQKFKKDHVIDALIGLLLIGVGLILTVGFLIDRPIKRMIRVIRRIEDGDLSARMSDDKKDEFGLVAKSFNSMLESVETAKKEVEQYHVAQMQQAAKLASLGEIISGIAHEIKNPLAGISCAVQVFHSEMREDDSRKAVTTEILNHIKRLDRTVKDLLHYARPKPPRFMPLKIHSILDKVIFFVYPEAKKQNVTIETDIKDDIPDVMMDPDQMQQVFLNLMINAVQAMPEGGKLKIATQEAEKDSCEDKKEVKDMLTEGRAVIISFEDSGNGIAPDHLESIFDPFFTKKSKGTGLGLSISQRIVQEHGGEFTVESEVGKGSIFKIYLPGMHRNESNEHRNKI